MDDMASSMASLALDDGEEELLLVGDEVDGANQGISHYGIYIKNSKHDLGDVHSFSNKSTGSIFGKPDFIMDTQMGLSDEESLMVSTQIDSTLTSTSHSSVGLQEWARRT
ncbi:hypothetical protein V6N12_032847 [Hibiscus sabdariffa]|uniref:Uncharacterized protein n=1 Tax=Hibiscus sabdariffa TaxID=183260 RepID=A0ABR2BBT4_9ROSI